MAIHNAFNDWYFNGPFETWWCEIDQTYHSTEEDCEATEDLYYVESPLLAAERLASFEAAIETSDEVSTFSLALEGSLISDDAVDMEIWRATHSAND